MSLCYISYLLNCIISGESECASVIAGVTSVLPQQQEFPSTMTDLGHGSWMVSGASVLQDGNTIMNGYECDLDKLKEGSHLGIMRKSDCTLHFFVDGEDCGVAATSVPTGLYMSFFYLNLSKLHT